MDPNYDTAAKVILDLIENYDLSIIDSSIVLNVNTPNKVFSADLDYKITSIGKWGKRNPPHVEKEEDDQITYWTSHRENCPPNESNSDISALKNNTISISPIYPKFSYGTVPNINFNLQKK
jgi:5'-nucleotidase